MIDNIISEWFVFISILIPLTLVACWMFISQKPKKDKQLAVLDAYIDSVRRANDLVTVELPTNNGKTYKRLIKKLKQDFRELHRMIISIKDIDDISYGNFIFSNCRCFSPQFKNKEIYDCEDYRWKLSPSETLSLMKEWPEAKLEILKIHKQNILDFNHIVNELGALV